MRRRVAIAVVLFACFAVYGLTQLVAPPQTPAAYLPEGALIYLEAKQLKDLLVWWKDSPVRSEWMQSANFRRFQSSRLYLKLGNRLRKIGGDGAFSFDLENLIRVSGGRSGLALYDIGELKVVFLTQTSFAEAEATEIWAARRNFREKIEGDCTYYVEPKQSAFAFAYAKPFLAVASDPELLVRTLRHFSQSADQTSISETPNWNSFADKRSDKAFVSLLINQRALQTNRYFRRYWIHGTQNNNLTGIDAVWIDLSRDNDAITERRYYVPAGTANTGSGPGAWSRPLVEGGYEFVSVTSPPKATQVATRILKLANPYPEQFRQSSYPPKFSNASQRAAQAETKTLYLQKIDEKITVAETQQVLNAEQKASIAAIIQKAEPQTEIRVEYPLWDTQALFAQFPSCVAVRFAKFDALDHPLLLDEIKNHYVVLTAAYNESLRWQQQHAGTYVLSSQHPLSAYIENPWVIFCNKESELLKLQRLIPKDTPPAGVFAKVQWKQGRWKYSRLMRRLDVGEPQTGSPLFFSQDIDSLLYVLRPVISSSIERTSGTELVRYELER